MADSDLELALRIRAAFEGQQAITDLATSFFDINKNIETLKRGLTSLSGSTEGAIKEFEYIKSVADKNGLSILDLADNYLKLASSVKGTALEGESTKKIFDSLSSALNVLGADTVTTHRAFNSLAQMMSKGQIYSEELKGQLAEALPGALQIMASALKISTKEMLDLMSAGQLSSDVLLPFAYELDKRYGTLSTSTTTFVQAMNRLKNTWTEFMEQIGNTGIWNGIVQSIEWVGESTGVVAGAVGAALLPALIKASDATKSWIISSKESIDTLRLQGTATQIAAKESLAKAKADEFAALMSERQAQLVVDQAATTKRAAQLVADSRLKIYNDLVKQNAAIDKITIAQEKLDIANERVTNATTRHGIASEKLTTAQTNAAGATVVVQNAQDKLTASTGLLSKAWGWLVSPAGTIALMIAGFAAMALMFREQDEATKTLEKSTEDYNESLKKLNAVQVEEVVRTSEKIITAKEEEISAIEEEIILIDQQADSADRASHSWYSFLNVLKFWQSNADQRRVAIEDLTKAQEDLNILEGKHASALEESAQRLVSLNSVQEAAVDKVNKLRFEAGNLKDAINLLSKAYPLTSEETIKLGLYTDQLRKNQVDLTKAESESKTSKDLLTKSIQNFSKATGISEQDIRLAITASEDEISALDEKEQAIIRSVKSYLSLHQEYTRTEADLKRLSAEHKNNDVVLSSNADMLKKVATVYGLLAEKREADLNKANVGIQLAREQLVISEKELVGLNNELRIKTELLGTSDKNAEKNQKELDKIKDLISQKEAEISKRKDSIKISEAEAEAIRLSVQLSTKSYDEWKSKTEELQTETDILHQRLNELLSDPGSNALEVLRVFDQIQKNETELSKQTDGLKAIMVDAFKSIGVDSEQALTGMDFNTRKLIDSLDLLGKTGNLVGIDLAKSINKAINTADTEEEIKAVILALFNLEDAGKISGEQLSLSLGEAYKKLVDLKSITDPVQQALEKLGIGVPEKLKAVADENERLYNIVKASKAPIDEVQQAFLKYAESSLVAAQNGAKIDEAQLKAKASSLGLSAAFEELKRKTEEQGAEFEAIIAQYERLRTVSEKYQAIASGEIDVRSEQNKSSQLRNENLGFEIGLMGDLIKEYQLKIDSAKQEVKASSEKLSVYQDEVKKLEALKASKEGISKIQQDQLDQMKLEIPLLEQSIQKSQEKVKQSESESLSMKNIVGDLNKVIEVTQQDLTLANDTLRSKRSRLEAENALALAMGDTTKAQQTAQEINKVDLEILDNIVKAKQEAANAADAYVEKLIKQTEEDGKLTAEEIKAIEIVKELAKQKHEEADASEVAAEATKKKAEADRDAAEASKKAAEAEALRVSASQAATTVMNNALAAVQALSGNTEALTERFNELQRTTGNIGTSMADWMGNTAGAVREVTQEYESQQGRLNALTETLQHFAATGEYTSEVQRAMAAAAGDAGNQFSLLDQEDLGNLRAALDSANAKLRDMQQETESARDKLAQMNAELLEAKGEDQKAKLLRQQIDYQERLAEIETQRREAELLGNTQLVAILDQQAQVLRQINDTKVASIQADQSAEQAGDKVARSWQGAEGAIRSAGTALAETHRTATNLANVNLDGLVAGLKGAAGHAQLLRDTL